MATFYFVTSGGLGLTQLILKGFMSEPITPVVATGIWATMSVYTGFAWGVDAQMLCVAAFGALAAVSVTPAPSATARERALSVLAWTASIVIAAVFAEAVVDYYHLSRKVEAALACLLGFGGTSAVKGIVAAGGRLVDGLVKKAGGE